MMLLNGKWTVGTSGHPTGGCTLCRGQSQLEHLQTEQPTPVRTKKYLAYVLQTLLFKEGLNFFELVVFFRTRFHQQSNFLSFPLSASVCFISFHLMLLDVERGKKWISGQ